MNSSQIFKNKVFLVGAGISIDSPSNIPAGAPIMDLLMEWIAPSQAALEELKEYAKSPIEKNSALFDFLRFELLIERIYQFEPDVLEHLSVLQLNGFSNFNHYFLAAFMKYGGTVITTNFDTRIEEAAEDLDVSYKRLVLGFSKFNPKQNYNLIKLHGTFPNIHEVAKGKETKSQPFATLLQIGKLGFAFNKIPKLKNYLLDKLSGKELYVMGYSASDSFDVVPLIEEISWKKVVWNEFQNSTQIENLEVNPYDQFSPPFKQPIPFPLVTMGIIKNNFPDTEIYAIKSNVAAFLEHSFKDLFTRLSQNEGLAELIKKNQQHYTSSSAIELFKEVLEENPFPSKLKDFVVDEILEERYGNWENMEITPIEHIKEFYPIRELIKNEKYARAIKEIKKLETSQIPDIADEIEILKAELQLKQGNLEAGYAILKKRTEINTTDMSVLANIETWLYLYIDMFYNFFFDQKFQMAYRVARKIIQLSEKSGIIWGVIKGYSLCGMVFMQYGFDTLNGQKKLKYPYIHYFNISEKYLLLSAYYALRITRLEIYFESLRMLAHIYTATQSFEQAKEIGEKLFKMEPFFEDPEKFGVLSIQMFDICMKQDKLKTPNSIWIKPEFLLKMASFGLWVNYSAYALKLC